MVRVITLAMILLLLCGCKGGGGGETASDPRSNTSGSDSGIIIPDNPDSGSYVGPVETYHTPEPSSMVLLGIGLAGLAAAAAKKKKK